PLAREVSVLRAFRDGILMRNITGRALVRTYYRVSPPVARVIERHEMLKAVTRLALRPAIIGAQVTLASPRGVFVAFAGVWSTLVALLVALVLAHRGVRAKHSAFVVTFLTTLSLTLAVGFVDFDQPRVSSKTAPVAHSVPAAKAVGRSASAEQGIVSEREV